MQLKAPDWESGAGASDAWRSPSGCGVLEMSVGMVASRSNVHPGSIFACPNFRIKMCQVSIMVRSILDPTINYPEIRGLDDDDVDYDAASYDADYLDVPVTIAVGQARYAFIDKNVVYYPVYLLSDGAVAMQIGVYEVLANRVPGLADSDGDLDLEMVGTPLLYSYVSRPLLQDYTRPRTAGPAKEVEPQEVEPQEVGSQEVGSQEVGSQEVDLHYEETGEEGSESDEDGHRAEGATVSRGQSASDAARERREFVHEEGETWVQEYMSNSNYGETDNEGAGDCLFAAIRDGLETVGEQTSVAELRATLVEHASESVFRGYRTMYLDALSSARSLGEELRALNKQLKALKARKSEAEDRNTQAVLVMQASEVAARHAEVKAQKRTAEEFLAEWNWMRGIDTIEAFHARIQTCEFWGDTWAVSTLEVALNIKLILLSEDAFDAGDLDNVLQCGQMNDVTLEEQGEFVPRLYIILDYAGEHYQLVTYKEKGAFTFEELPHDIKRLIVDKCLERQSGAFALIPAFREFMKETQVLPPSPEPSSNSGLHNDHTVFQFYSKSNDRPRPGKGAGESLGPEGASAYNELSAIQQWRKKLSNFWEQEFELDGKRWLSVEHYYQASKFKKGNPEFYDSFALDSGSDISKSPAVAKAAGGKTGKKGRTQLRPSSVSMDPDFFSGRHVRAMEDAMRAKFSQNEDLAKTLLATGSAKLQHFVRGASPVVFDDLMRVRKQLREEQV